MFGSRRLIIGFVFLFATMITEAQGDSPAQSQNRGFSEIDWGFGVGIGFVDDFSGTPRVKRASLDANGIVRVDERANDGARLVLESHWFFDEKMSLWGSDVHHGPFVTVSGGDENFLDAFGAGYLFGFARPNGSTSWNIGIGVINDREVQVLGDGIEPDMPLEDNETSIRFKTTDKWGAMITFSLGFGLDRESDRSRTPTLSEDEFRELNSEIDLITKKAEADAAQKIYEDAKKKANKE